MTKKRGTSTLNRSIGISVITKVKMEKPAKNFIVIVTHPQMLQITNDFMALQHVWRERIRYKITVHRCFLAMHHEPALRISSELKQHIYTPCSTY